MEIIVALQSFANPTLDAVALAVTHSGSETAYIVLLLVTYLAIDPVAGRTLGIAVLGGYYLNQVAKEVVATPRPFVVEPALLRSEAAAASAPGFAFPSGHAQLATTFWGMAAALARRRWVWGVSLVAILLIGATRVYLGVHWPVDVVGGMLLGFAVAVFALAALGTRTALPPPLVTAAWAVVPIAVHVALPTEESGLVAGALAGFATGHRFVRHRPPTGWGRRALLTLLGLLLVFGWLFGTSVALDDSVRDHPLVEPLRYFVAAWMGVVVAPWLGIRLDLAREAEST